MLTIWKATLPIKPQQEIEVPENSKFLFIAEQDGELTIWFKCDPGANTEKRKIVIKGTGHFNVPEPGLSHYIGSCLMSNGLVWHVFEILDMQS